MSNIKKDLQLLAYAKTGLLKRLQRSINIGSNVDSSDHFGRSALLLSLVYGHLDAARLLIASGAYLDERFFSKGTGMPDNFKKIDRYDAKVNLLFDLSYLLMKEKGDTWSAKVSCFEYYNDDNSFKNLFLNISSGLNLKPKFKIISELIKSKDIDKLIQISAFNIIYWRHIEKQFQDLKKLSLFNIAPLLDFYQLPLICHEGKSICGKFIVSNDRAFNFNINEFANLFFLNNPEAKSHPKDLKKIDHECKPKCKCALSIYNKAISKKDNTNKNLSPSGTKYIDTEENKRLKVLYL